MTECVEHDFIESNVDYEIDTMNSETQTTVRIQANLLNEVQAADYLAVSPRTLRNWRTRGGGPKYVRISARCIRYRMSDLSEWTENRTRRSTSDFGIFN